MTQSDAIAINPFYLPVILLVVFILSTVLTVPAQNKQSNREDLERSEDSLPIRFIREAPDLLDAALRETQPDQLLSFLESWKKSAIPSNELIFSIDVLLAIETNRFSLLHMPCDAFYFLDDYAREWRQMEEDSRKFRYFIRISAIYSFDATRDVRKILGITQAWARRLIAEKKLDSTEWFLCQVFAGEITHPAAAFEKDRKHYPELDGFQQSLDRYKRSVMEMQRNSRTGVIAITLGSWIPTGNLRILGAHPGIGTILGIRDKLNEYDLLSSFRFLHPTPQYYSVRVNGKLYNSDYYDGGYIGLDYTRYLLHKINFEWGLTSAIGWDYFDYIGGSRQSSDSALAPISSFDFSNGMRIKYFIHRGMCIGLAAKYHLINYCNKGGSDLGGNAFTIDLIYGAN